MKKILLVDDEESIREILSEILIEEAYSVATAPNGTEGLEALKRESFDLALVDKQMPDMDGALFIAQAQILRPEMRIIMLTGSIDRSPQLKINGYLMKPVAIDIFLETIQTALRGEEVPQAIVND